MDEKQLSGMMKTQHSIPTPDFEKIWVNIQQNKKNKQQIKNKLLIPAAVISLGLSIVTVSKASEILDYFEVKVGNLHMGIENKSPIAEDQSTPKNVTEYLTKFNFSEAADVLGFIPVQPTYIPAGFNYTNEEGIKGIPAYTNDKLTGVDEENPSYHFYYSKGKKPEDLLHVSYNINQIKPNHAYGSLPRKNPEPINVSGRQAISHDNGILMYKELPNNKQLQLEIFTEGKLPREEFIKIMKSLLEKL